MIVSPSRFALIGKTGAGKSEVAHILQDELSCEVIKTGKICRQISNLLFGNEDKKSTQILDDALTTIDNSIFLRAALRGIDLHQALVIDSLRFISDFVLAQDLGVRTVRVIANDENRRTRLAGRGQEFDFTADGQHRSEVELDGVSASITVYNDGSREELRTTLLAHITVK